MAALCGNVKCAIAIAFLACIRIGAVCDQTLHKLEPVIVDSKHERGESTSRGGVHIGTANKQAFDHLRMATSRGKDECGELIVGGVARLDIGPLGKGVLDDVHAAQHRTHQQGAIRRIARRRCCAKRVGRHYCE